VIFVDQATDACLSSDAALRKIDRLGVAVSVAGSGAAGAGCCDTRSHVVSELVEEVWLMPET
jgi:hypothetical protein